jgi:hypothetical protein
MKLVEEVKVLLNEQEEHGNIKNVLNTSRDELKKAGWLAQDSNNQYTVPGHSKHLIYLTLRHVSHLVNGGVKKRVAHDDLPRYLEKLRTDGFK